MLSYFDLLQRSIHTERKPKRNFSLMFSLSRLLGVNRPINLVKHTDTALYITSAIINDKQKLFAFDECEWVLGTIFKAKIQFANPDEYFRQPLTYRQNFGLKILDVLQRSIHS